MFTDNQEFVNNVKNELFSQNIYVYTSKGDIIELPKGSTVIDYVYKVDSNLGNILVGAYINDEYKEASYVLQNKDRVRVVTNDMSFGPRKDWLNIAHTSLARRKIMEFNERL